MYIAGLVVIALLILTQLHVSACEKLAKRSYLQGQQDALSSEYRTPRYNRYKL